MPEPSQARATAHEAHVAEVLIAFVNRHLMSRNRPVHPDDRLEDAGIDSMAFLRVLLFIEAEFGFWIPDDDLSEENVASVRAIARYICRHDACADPSSSGR